MNATSLLTTLLCIAWQIAVALLAGTLLHDYLAAQRAAQD